MSFETLGGTLGDLAIGSSDHLPALVFDHPISRSPDVPIPPRVRLEHSLAIHDLIPNSDFTVIPDAGHFALDAEPGKVLPVFEAFLDAPSTKLPFATTAVRYQPGAAR